MRNILYAMLGLMLLLGACDISKPQLPQWDVDLTVPLLNERFLVSELVDSVNVVIGDNEVLTITATGHASTPDFGEVNFTPEVLLDDLPLLSGIDIETTVPLFDPTGRVHLVYGRIEQGSLSFKLGLADPQNSSVTLILPEITTAGGTPLTISSNNDPNWQSLNLSGYSAGVENSSEVLDELRVRLIVQSNQPDGTPLGTAGLSVNTQIGCDYFQGYLYEYVRSIGGTFTSVEFVYPEDLGDALTLQEARVRLQLTNEIGFGATFHGMLHAVNTRTGQERWVQVLDDNGQPFWVDPAESSGPVVTDLIFTEGISDLLQIMPDQVELVDGYLLINGGHNEAPGFVRESDRLRCVYQVDLPCHFVINGYEYTMSKPNLIEIEADTQAQIRDRVLAAALTLGVTNHIPVGAGLTLYLGPSEEIDPSDPATFSFSKQVTVHSSEYEGPAVDEFGEQIISLALNREELELFTQPSVYVLVSVNFLPSNGPVIIHASPADFIQIRGMLTAKLHVSEDLL